MAIFQESEDDLESELNKGALWAVTYGDLMSYLMIFFLTILAFTVSNIQDYDALVKALKGQFGDLTEEQIRVELTKKEDTLAEQLAKILGSEQVAVNEERVKITFSSPLLFDFGKAELKPEAEKALAPMVEVFNKVTNNIIVEGHTDNRPISRKLRYKSNFELSAARAYAVIQLLEKQGIGKERLIGMAYGDARPVASNDEKEGRAQNRRIEISLVRQKQILARSSVISPNGSPVPSPADQTDAAQSAPETVPESKGAKN